MTRVWPALLLAAVLSACGPPSGPSADRLEKRSLQYWLDHPAERAEVLAECRVSEAAEAEHNARFRAYWERKIQPREKDPWLALSQ